MARIAKTDEQLRPLFDSDSLQDAVDGFPCGVCSVGGRGGPSWAICSRRLLTLQGGINKRQSRLISRILALGGYKPGEKVQVWSEISLSDSSESGTKFDYRLDYVLRSAKKRKNAPPVIIEVMAASTSGGNRKEGTDIQAAFRHAVLFANGIIPGPPSSPGANVRQVWARMASQMIAKSEAANAWGGRTIWVVQDLLVDYMRKNTGLRLDALRSPNWGASEVNMISVNLNAPEESAELYAGPIHPGGDTGVSWLELLRAPHVPRLESLLAKLEEKAPVAVITVPSP